MKTPARVAIEVMNRHYGAESPWGEPNIYGEVGFTRAQAETDIDAWQIVEIIAEAIEADRAQRGPKDDGTVDRATIVALQHRALFDTAGSPSEAAAERAADWVEENPDEFWVRYAGPMLDTIQNDHLQGESDD